MNVRFEGINGHDADVDAMSAFDPKRTSAALQKSAPDRAMAVIDQHGEMARERLGRAITKAWQCDPADHPKMLDDPNEPTRRN